MGGTHLNKPMVGMAGNPAMSGYWLVAGDGGIFAFDAPFLGSTGNLLLNQPVIGMESSPAGTGYRFVAADGGIFSFGTSQFAGSAVAPPPSPVPTSSQCRAAMSNPTPPAESDETVTYQSSVADAPVIATVNYHFSSSTFYGSTGANGDGAIIFRIYHPKPGYPVAVDVNIGDGAAQCATSFVPRLTVANRSLEDPRNVPYCLHRDWVTYRQSSAASRASRRKGQAFAGGQRARSTRDSGRPLVAVGGVQQKVR